jgi:XTP/dITP diphosphohydrolase
VVAAETLRPLVLATRSAGKIRELTALCAADGIAVETLAALGIAESPEEDALEVFETFAENAQAKARYFAARLPGRVVLAEDSGLVVDALGGAPGVRSKRWSGSNATGAQLDAENNAALAHALREVTDRRARYVCAAVVVSPRGEWTSEGRVEGRIFESPRGEGGFGYDPWFFSTELGCGFGEALPEEKARVSHRARAVRSVLATGGAVLRAQLAPVS